MTRSRDVADTQDNLGGAVAPFLAGKNKIINGDFGIWQRGTTFNNFTFGSLCADRFLAWWDGTGATRNLSQQTFTPGATPSGYESQFFFRYAQTVAGTGGTYNNCGQNIEDVRTFAGQTATFSFWARVSSGTITVQAYGEQNFGSGGSGSTYTQFGTDFTVTTSWQRFTGTVSLPSVSGKTIGTTNKLTVYLNLPRNATFTFDTWGWQLEAGSVATPFTLAGGGFPGAELALCQRYYWRFTGGPGAYINFGTGFCTASNATTFSIPYPVVMRAQPTSLETTGTASNYAVLSATGGLITLTGTPTYDGNTNATAGIVIANVSSGLVAGNGTQLRANNSTTAYLGWSAEL